MQDTSSDSKKAGRPWLGFVIGACIVVAMAALLVLNSPRGYDMDLGKIGTGQPAVVLVYDPNLVVSGEQIHELDQIRSELESKTLFLVADVGRAEGQALARQYKVGPPSILIFAADGTLLKTLHNPVAAEALQKEIETALSW